MQRSGESFDRQASFRRVVSNTDSLSRRSRNLSRRKTVTGIPGDVNRKLGIRSIHSTPHSLISHFIFHSCPFLQRSITQCVHQIVTFFSYKAFLLLCSYLLSCQTRLQSLRFFPVSSPPWVDLPPAPLPTSRRTQGTRWKRMTREKSERRGRYPQGGSEPQEDRGCPASWPPSPRPHLSSPVMTAPPPAALPPQRSAACHVWQLTPR